jgi:hypothetical protein
MHKTHFLKNRSKILFRNQWQKKFHRKPKIKLLKSVLLNHLPVFFLIQPAVFSELRYRKRRKRNLLNKRRMNYSKDSLSLSVVRLTRNHFSQFQVWLLRTVVLLETLLTQYLLVFLERKLVFHQLVRLQISLWKLKINLKPHPLSKFNFQSNQPMLLSLKIHCSIFLSPRLVSYKKMTRRLRTNKLKLSNQTRQS